MRPAPRSPSARTWSACTWHPTSATYSTTSAGRAGLRGLSLGERPGDRRLRGTELVGDRPLACAGCGEAADILGIHGRGGSGGPTGRGGELAGGRRGLPPLGLTSGPRSEWGGRCGTPSTGQPDAGEGEGQQRLGRQEDGDRTGDADGDTHGSLTGGQTVRARQAVDELGRDRHPGQREEQGASVPDGATVLLGGVGGPRGECEATVEDEGDQQQVPPQVHP